MSDRVVASRKQIVTPLDDHAREIEAIYREAGMTA
jgi:hypothetical protein